MDYEKMWKSLKEHIENKADELQWNELWDFLGLMEKLEKGEEINEE